MPVSPADALTFLDAVVPALQAAFDAAGIETTVSREYAVEYDLGKFTGLKCVVMPTSYKRAGAATRKENYYEPEFVVVVAERFADTGTPPKAWLDERVNTVQACVFDVLEKIDPPLGIAGYWVAEAECTCVFDTRMLREHKVFWSETECVFRRVRPTK